MQRPLFLEGEAGVGKTEIAKVLAATLGRRLIRLQCYEGLDVAAAVYEWNYARQMMRDPPGRGGRRSADRDALARDIFTRPLPDQAARCCRRSSRTRPARRCC